jgi:hypothetical protein
MPTYDVFLARTYKVRMQAPDAAIAEEFVGDVADRADDQAREDERFRITGIELLDNRAFDAIEIEE